MQLTGITRIHARLELLSGLRVGAGDTTLRIGGVDNPVIKHPHTEEPYIPGSSVKGRMRSLLEWRAGLVGIADGKPFGLKALERVADPSQRGAGEAIIRLFGISGGDDVKEGQYHLVPTRLSVWDCPLDASWRESAANLPLTEVKTENMINRISGTAEHPRQTERVPAQAVFDFNLSLKRIDGEDLLPWVFAAMKLVEWDSLGGSGSRGYGKVRFAGVTVDGEDRSATFAAVDPFAPIG